LLLESIQHDESGLEQKDMPATSRDTVLIAAQAINPAASAQYHHYFALLGPKGLM
jgi:hypothetical protein